jgi:hypothetical protein
MGRDHGRALDAISAAAARDLGAVWALWSEHCRLNPQGGAPDLLALEIVMDAAARARRPDVAPRAVVRERARPVRQ